MFTLLLFLWHVFLLSHFSWWVRLCFCLAGCFVWSAQHWNLQAGGWSQALVPTWVSPGDLTLINIHWYMKFSVSPTACTWWSHHGTADLTPGMVTKRTMPRSLILRGNWFSSRFTGEWPPVLYSLCRHLCMAQKGTLEWNTYQEHLCAALNFYLFPFYVIFSPSELVLYFVCHYI